MTDLLSRLQSEGPSLELDAEIALANGWKQISDPKLIAPYWRSPTGQICPHLPRYTESIDAALTLVPSWANSHGYDFCPKGVDAYVSLNNVASGHKLFDGHHASSHALALLIAIRRAQEDTKT